MNIDASRIKRKKKITFVKFHSRFVFVYTHPSGVHSVYYRQLPGVHLTHILQPLCLGIALTS